MRNRDLEIQFEWQVKEHERLIHKVCRVYCKTEVDHQDLYQEILIQLWRAFPKFRGKAKFSTWLYRIAIYTAIAGFRKSKAITVITDNESLLGLNKGYETSFKDHEEKFDMLYRAIDLLNEIDKAIVMLYLEERSYDEMEEVLGISQGNLRVKMTRIKDKLRQITKNM